VGERLVLVRGPCFNAAHYESGLIRRRAHVDQNWLLERSVPSDMLRLVR
jgi:hypothetical protein